MSAAVSNGMQVGRNLAMQYFITLNIKLKSFRKIVITEIWSGVLSDDAL